MKELAEKYLEGLTTCGEEQRLRDFFGSPTTVAGEDMRWLRALSGYVEQEKHPARGSRWKLWAALKTAACAAMVVAAWLMFPPDTGAESFAVIDGVRVEDPQTVEAEAMKALDMVCIEKDEVFDALDVR